MFSFTISRRSAFDSTVVLFVLFGTSQKIFPWEKQCGFRNLFVLLVVSWRFIPFLRVWWHLVFFFMETEWRHLQDWMTFSQIAGGKMSAASFFISSFLSLLLCFCFMCSYCFVSCPFHIIRRRLKGKPTPSLTDSSPRLLLENVNNGGGFVKVLKLVLISVSPPSSPLPSSPQQRRCCHGFRKLGGDGYSGASRGCRGVFR